MRLVVTGAAGFVGSHLCRRLVADGHRVTGLDDLSTGRLAALRDARGKGFSFATFDCAEPALADLLAHERPDVLCVLTPALPPGVQAISAAAATGVPRVVLASSAAVYGGVPAASERVVPHPRTAAAAVAVSLEAHLEALVPGVALRLGTVYGPRDRGVVGRWAADLRAGRTAEVPASGALDLVHVDDVVDAVVRCLGGKADGRRLNVGSGRLTPYRELHRLVAAAVGAPDAPSFGPPGPSDPALECGAARRALGWEPVLGLEEGLARTVAET